MLTLGLVWSCLYCHMAPLLVHTCTYTTTRSTDVQTTRLSLQRAKKAWSRQWRLGMSLRTCVYAHTRIRCANPPTLELYPMKGNGMTLYASPLKLALLRCIAETKIELQVLLCAHKWLLPNAISLNKSDISCLKNQPDAFPIQYPQLSLDQAIILQL